MSAQHVVVPLNRHSDILKDEDLLLGLLQPTFYSTSTTSRSSMCLHHDPDLVWKALVPQYPVFSATGGLGVLSEDSKSESLLHAAASVTFVPLATDHQGCLL